MLVLQRFSAVLLVVALFILSTVLARSQEHAQHPPAGAPDPYATAKDQSGNDCCRGRDCGRWEGTVKRVQGGWLFGPHFVHDGGMIKVETLPVEERWHHQLCLFAKTVRCGFVAAGM